MIDPTFMGAIEWTDRMAMLLPSIPPMKITREEEWKTWADYVSQFPQISQYNPPSPETYSNWRDWAYRFNEMVPTL